MFAFVIAKYCLKTLCKSSLEVTLHMKLFFSPAFTLLSFSSAFRFPFPYLLAFSPSFILFCLLSSLLPNRFPSILIPLSMHDIYSSFSHSSFPLFHYPLYSLYFLSSFLIRSLVISLYFYFPSSPFSFFYPFHLIISVYNIFSSIFFIPYHSLLHITPPVFFFHPFRMFSYLFFTP